MADTTATTGGDSTGGDSAAQSSYESEFSHPVGAEDGKTWEKYFGKDAPWPKDEKPRDKSSTKSSESSGKRSDKSDSDGSKKTKSDAKPSSDARSTERSQTSSEKSETSAKESSTPKESKSPKKADDSDKADAKAKDDADAPDAKKTYAKAKAEKDPRQARKLYRDAMKEAFGEVPDEFNDAKWASARKKLSDDQASIKAERDKNEARIHEAVQKLQPAVRVMQKIKESGVADYTLENIDRAVDVLRALKELEAGDYTGLGKLVAKASRVEDVNEAMQRFTRGVKVSPEGRAARQAAEQAQKEAAETRRQLAEMQRQLEQERNGKTEAQKKAETEQRRQQARTRWLADIADELGDHPAMKLPKGQERVLRYLIKTRDPVLKTPRYTVEQAADRIVAHEKKRLADLRFLESGSGEEAPATRETPRTPSRRDSAENGIDNPDPMARFDYFWSKHTGGQRAAGGRR